MLKNEFEYLVGKFVTEETYNDYNAMYMVCRWSKETFVEIIDKSKVQEDPYITNRRNIYLETLKELENKISSIERSYSNGYLTEKDYHQKMNQLKYFVKETKKSIKDLIPTKPF